MTSGERAGGIDVGAARRARRAGHAVLILVAVLVLAACTSGGSHQASGTKASGTTSATASPTPTGPKKGSGKPVRVSLFEADGRTYGVGMPIIAYFSHKITDASVFNEVVKVTVNGQPAGGAWYWQPSQRSNAGIEAHYRPPQYWPAHAAIHVEMPLDGLWAG